jgi:hypothetical protein
LRVLVAVLLFFGFLSHALGAPMDLSVFKAQFEQRISDRVQASLDPLLGRGNYTINVRADVDESRANKKPEKTYFPKLGLSIVTPDQEPTAVMSEKWVRALSVQVGYSTTIDGLKSDDLKKQIEAILKPVSPVDAQVEISAFTPLHSSPASFLAQLAKFPWTPFAIVLCGALLGYAVVTSSRRLEQVSKARAQADSPRAQLPEQTLPTGLPTQDNGTFAQEGLAKWRQWLEQDLASARAFVEKLARSHNTEEELLLAYALQSIDLKWTKPLLQKFPPETLSALKESLALEIPGGKIPSLDRQLASQTAQSFFEQQADTDNVLEWLHDLTVQECVAVSEHDLEVLPVFMKFYSTPHMEQILSLLSDKQYAAFLQLSKKSQTLDHGPVAKRAHDWIVESRKRASAAHDPAIARMLLITSHLEVERGQAFFEANPHLISNEELKSLAVKNYPKFLISGLPEQILKPVLGSYPLEHRAALIVSLPQEFRDVCIGLYKNENRMREVLEFELEKLSERGAQEVTEQEQKAHADFYERIRKYIRSSEENEQLAEAALAGWFKNRGGKNGFTAA